MVKIFLKITACLLPLAILCACGTVLPSESETTVPTITETTETALDATEAAKISAETLIPMISHENWWLTNGITKHSFSLVVGLECIRETPYKSYAVVQNEYGDKYFIFFDKSEITCGEARARTFHTNEEFLDFVVGTCPGREEMHSYDNFRFSLTDIDVYYTQQGVFLISYPYHTFYTDGEPQETVRYVRILAYYDYEELDVTDDSYVNQAWFILPQDRTQ